MASPQLEQHAKRDLVREALEESDTFSGGAIIWRPGSVGAGNVFATWPEVQAAVDRVQGATTIFVDSSIAPAVVPPAPGRATGARRSPANALVEFVVDLTGWGSGEIGDMIACFGLT
jgi:hypothetical protein